MLLDAIARSDGTRASVERQLLATESREGSSEASASTANGDIDPAAITIFRVRGGTRPNSTLLTDFDGGDDRPRDQRSRRPWPVRPVLVCRKTSATPTRTKTTAGRGDRADRSVPPIEAMSYMCSSAERQALQEATRSAMQRGSPSTVNRRSRTGKDKARVLWSTTWARGARRHRRLRGRYSEAERLLRRALEPGLWVARRPGALRQSESQCRCCEPRGQHEGAACDHNV